MNYSSSIEALEARIAPATITVTLAGGVLKILGDAGVDDITIDYTGDAATAALTLTPNIPGDIISFNGVAGAPSAAKTLLNTDTLSVTKIVVDLGGGVNDAQFTVGALADPDSTFKQAITYTGGTVADHLHFGDFKSTAGFTAKLGEGDDSVDFKGVSSNEVQFGGDVSIDLGAGGNNITTTVTGGFFPDLTFDGALKIIGGSGPDSISLGAANNAAGVSVAKTLTITGGLGVNTVAIAGLNISLAKTTISSTEKVATSSISIQGSGDTKINGGLTVTNAGSVNTFDLDGATLSVTGGVSYKGGLGSDGVNIGAIATIGTIGGKVSIANGEGANATDIGNASGALYVGGSISATGGAGSDTLAVKATSGVVTGAISATLGKGISDVSVIAAGLNVGGLTVKTVDIVAATDALTLKGVTFTKAVSVSLGAGVSTVTVDDITAMDKFTLLTGAGADVVNIEADAAATSRSYFFGATNINVGIGDDTVTIGDTFDSDKTAAVFLSPLTVDLGLGTDLGPDFDASIFFSGVSGVLENSDSL